METPEIRENDFVVLNRDVELHHLCAGDVGTVVHIYPEASAYEVEFILSNGDTVGVLTLEPNEIRPPQGTEILHVRHVSS